MMEISVYKAVSLLRILSKKVGDEMESQSGDLATDEAVGLDRIAGDCAAALKLNWKAAHDETAVMARTGKPCLCPAAAGLYLHVEKAITLLNLMAEMLAGFASEDAVAEARRRGEIPTIGSSGYICLAHDVEKELRREFDAGFEAWNQLERQIKEQVTALETRRAA